jgi:DNA-binding NtrC family response regulator
VAKAETPHRQHILVVDHDELVRWSVAEGLKEHGFPVQIAANVRDALQSPEVAVALLDHDPPPVDGLAAATRLRRCHPRCAVVLMTPEPTPGLDLRAREQGIVRILGKPFSLETLVDAVHDALEGAPGRSCPLRGSPPGADDAYRDARWQTEAPHGY